jgi:alpha-tubulin suppressor-like RCC1 family protein
VKISGTWGFGESIVGKPVLVAGDVLTASIGDSANYYVTTKGELFVKGRAHRGQYGDGKLSSSNEFIHTASDIIQVSSHTGHALILKKNGEVLGTGGNIYGPLSHHGYGDKAISWGKIFEGASRIASGSSHSVAIRQDGSLWSWGRNIGLEPKLIFEKAEAVAASSSSTIALSEGALWQWDRGKIPIRVIACE